MSLLNLVLNDEVSQVYDSDLNYDLRDVSVGAAIQTQTFSEFSPQAFTHNGIGFKAFILAYENQGLSPATTGKKNENGSSESAVPTDGEVGKIRGMLGAFAKSVDDIALRAGIEEIRPEMRNGTDDPKEQALAEAHFLNNVKIKVWIPALDKHIKPPEIYSPDPPLIGAAIKDLHLYQSCAILDEQHLQSLPPPGSLIMVDFKNRQVRSGLTLKSIICRDATFARIIMSEFAGVVDKQSIAAYFSEVPGGAFDFATGDPILPIPPREAALTPDKIQELAQNYDAESATALNKAQHSPFLDQAHPEFAPFMKAFLFKAWNDSQLTIQINSVYRTPTEQQTLIDRWKADPDNNVKPSPSSFHLLGMAMDFNPTLPNGLTLMKKKSITPTSAWYNSGVVAAADAVNLEWGGRWPTWYDPIHIDFRKVLVDWGFPTAMKGAVKKILEFNDEYGHTTPLGFQEPNRAALFMQSGATIV